ncbi:D-alanyl-D-alanine carboxypeptidase/D-alanyl-D-alanine endopeptidase [Pseudactinotalea sp. Z1748]|uniref:D-alanyl-D-alanine carboxypeptidase/D-alanyl-D-alanine endopeptidase n=1 Tax=Pseudactinotalea sp. Z1748 TaxID=3413027 RepID=UPI003C7A0096
MLRGYKAPLGAVVALAAGVIAAQAPMTGNDTMPSGDAPAWVEDVDRILADSRLDGALAGVVVQDARTGERLYEHNPGYRLMPASNVKMLTSAAAMELLGPDYTYTTTVLTDGERRGNSEVVHGDLYLKGDGDPTMLEQDYAALAEQVADAGIRRVHGDLVADDTRFDSQRLGPFWSWGDEDFYYSAQISALSVGPNEDYDAGTVIIDTAPGSAGEAAEVSVIPESDYITIDNQATTVAPGGSTSISVTRERGSNTWTVSGTIAADADARRVWRAVWEPAGKAAAVFDRALQDHGVEVTGDIRTGVSTPSGAEVVATHESMTLTELLNPFMKLSNNGHGEVLLKTLGDEVAGSGDWSSGAEVLRGYLESLGVTSELRLVDGSGLSRGNQIPAGEFATFLYEVQEADWFEDWYAEFPVACAGERMVGGTLNSRMCETPAQGNVHAKTGSLTGVTALSGYVTDADGRDLVFAMLFNNHLVGIGDIEDQIAVTLASHSEDGGAAVAPMAIDPASESDPDLECSWQKGEAAALTC